MAAPAPLPAATPGAASAFLRGVGRRALVVAELQGDAAGAHAVAAAMRAFSGQAATLAMADWPARFWGLLCNAPRLRAPVAATPLPHLSNLNAGDRLALCDVAHGAITGNAELPQDDLPSLCEDVVLDVIPGPRTVDGIEKLAVLLRGAAP